MRTDADDPACVRDPAMERLLSRVGPCDRLPFRGHRSATSSRWSDSIHPLRVYSCGGHPDESSAHASASHLPQYLLEVIDEQHVPFVRALVEDGAPDSFGLRTAVADRHIAIEV